MNPRCPPGFTLIELIVVIAVVAILVGVGLNRLTGYQEAASRGGRKQSGAICAAPCTSARPN